MQTTSLVKAINKAGFQITQKHRNKVGIENDRYICSWVDQDGRVVCLKIEDKRDPSQPEIDYFTGFFPSTIKQVIEWMSK